MPYKNYTDKQKYQEKYQLENAVKLKEKRIKYRSKNKARLQEYATKRRDDLKQHAINSITLGKITDQNKWNLWCNQIKSRSLRCPYSDDFTSDVMFEMMIQGCFYCGDIATTIDRVDSKLDHTTDNCVASCWRCNNSKGVTDPSTFIRKAYFRARGEYIDDITDIWHVNNTKPNMWHYKRNANSQGVPFDLTKGDFDVLINDKCEYCHRSPTTWFGVDRVVPSLGYVLDNVVTSCWDCNLDKHTGGVEMMMTRNECVAIRVDTCDLVIEKCDKMILHIGTHKSSRKVCVYGRVYENMSEASRALGKCENYVYQCILLGIHQNDIFEIFNKSV